MTHVSRVNGYYSGVVHGNIDELWDVLMDWGDISWFDLGDHDGPALAESFLEGEVDAIPRTRVMTRPNAVESGLYNADDGMIAGSRNYIASWTLDPISDDSCQMTIQSMYDVDDTGSMEVAKGWLDAVYEMIVHSLDKYMIKQRDKAATGPA